MGWYFQKPELLWEFLIFATFVVLLWTKRLPSIEGFGRFVALADSKGGNILILLFMTFISLVWSIRFGYYSIHAIREAVRAGAPPPPDTQINMMLSWLTGSVSGTFMGALVKTMTGEHPSPGIPSGTPTTTISTTSTTGDTNANPNPPATQP